MEADQPGLGVEVTEGEGREHNLEKIGGQVVVYKQRSGFGIVR